MRYLTGWIVAPMLVATGMLSAQERREPALQRDPVRPAASGQFTRGDQEIAAVKLAFCRNALELAKLGSQKAESDEVKQFAAKLFKEHTEACANLEKLAGPLAAPQGDRAERTVPGADVEVRVPPAAPGAPGARPGADVTIRGGQGGPLNWVAIHQQMADQCAATTKQELGKKEGAEFDKCFIGMALGGHQQAVIADQVFLKHVSPQFRGEVEDCLKTETAHLSEAKDIMAKLEGTSPRLTRKPEAAPAVPRRPE
jgi:predicted outer membrane protein